MEDDILIQIAEIKKQLDALQRSFLQTQANQVPITGKTDTAYGKVPQVDTNTGNIATNSEDIASTQVGLAETYEETTTSITQLEEALTEVYEMIIPPEE